jgi:hypothetical protein
MSLGCRAVKDNGTSRCAEAHHVAIMQNLCSKHWFILNGRLSC